MEKFVKQYDVRSYECDKDSRLRLLTIFNLMQDMADTHADLMGVGYDACFQKGIGWVGGNYHLRIHKLPKWREKIILKTWPTAKTFVTGIRDFEALNETGSILFQASSQWVLIDLTKGRPVAVAKNLGNYELLPERAIETQFSTPPLPERTDFEKKFFVRYDDIDMNNHVNNAVYPVWAAEAVPPAFKACHDVAELEVSFKKPALSGDVVLIETQIDDKTTRHLIKSETNGTIFAQVAIQWTVHSED